MLTIGLVGVLMTFGCASDGETRMDLTISTAKAIAQTGEMEVVKALPSAEVVGIDQVEMGSLVSCRGARNYRWAGAATAALVADSDPLRVISGLFASYREREGWSASLESTAAGEPRLFLKGPEGEWLIVDGLSDPARIDMSSLSPCFHLPDGQSPNGFF